MNISSSNLMRPLEAALIIRSIPAVKTSMYATYSVSTKNLEKLGCIKHHLKSNQVVYVTENETLLSIPRLNYLALYMQQLLISFEKASS